MTIFCLKDSTYRPHITRQKGFRELFHFCEDIRSQNSEIRFQRSQRLFGHPNFSSDTAVFKFSNYCYWCWWSVMWPGILYRLALENCTKYSNVLRNSKIFSIWRRRFWKSLLFFRKPLRKLKVRLFTCELRSGFTGVSCGPASDFLYWCIRSLQNFKIGKLWEL